MKLPALKQLSKTAWFVMIATVAMLLVWIIVIVPAVRRLQNTSQAILDTQTTQASSTQATASLISALQQHTKLADDAKHLEAFFIARSNPVAFVSRLEELADDHQVTLNVSLQEPDSALNGAIAQSTVSIEAAGQVEDVLAFMNDLLTEPVFLDVQSMNITTPSTTPGIITMTLNTISYWH